MLSPEVVKALAQSLLSAPQPSAPQQTAQSTAAPQQPAETEQPAAPAEDAPEGEPLLSQEDRESDENAQEAALEQRLRSEQDAANTPQAPQQAAEPMPMVDGAITQPVQLAAKSAENAQQNQQAIGALAQSQRKHLAQSTETQKAIANENSSAQANLAQEIQERHSHLERIQQQTEAAQQQQIAQYQQVNDEMMKMAAAQPKDVFGAAGVNGILGRIAVFLGGAGVNGYHANHNLEAINQMADRNIAQQRMRYEMLSKVGEGHRTVYGMLNAQLSNAFQVDSVLKNMSLEVAKQQMLTTASKYSDATIQEAANQEADKITAEQANNMAKVNQQVVEDGQRFLNSAATMQAAQTAQSAQQGSLAQKYENTQLKGFVGHVPQTEHARLSKMVAGSRTLVDGLNHMQTMLKNGASPKAVRQYFVDNAILFKGARDFLETGTRIEAGEQGVINALAQNNAEGIFTMLVGNDLSGLNGKIEEARRAVVAATFQNVKSAAPNTTALDSRDALFGRYNPRTYKGDFQSYFNNRYREYNGTDVGRGLMRKLPTFTP